MKRLFLVLLFITLATIVSSCNNSTSSFDVFAVFSKKECSIGMYQTMVQGQLDSLRSFCDTIYIRESITFHKDTVYDDTVIKNNHYTSFIYLNRYTGNTDTLVRRRAEKPNESGPCSDVPVYCELDSSDVQKTFKCVVAGLCKSNLYEDFQIVEVSKPKSVVKQYDRPSNVSLCRVPGYKCVVDTVYIDAFHTTFRKDTYDTSFLNYGKNAWTDYIPAINAPPFDTAAFRKALDTLDTQNEIFGMDTLFTGYSVSVEGLPDWASTKKRDTCMAKDSTTICIIKVTETFRPYGLANTYPTRYSKEPFYLTNYLESPLEKDTLITWKLKYRYLNANNFKEPDTLTITTLFKGI